MWLVDWSITPLKSSKGQVGDSTKLNEYDIFS